MRTALSRARGKASAVLARAPVSLEPVDHVAMIECLLVPVLLLDPVNRIRYANAAAEHFFGMSVSQLRHHEMVDFLPGDHPFFLLVDQVRRQSVSVVEHELVLDGPRLHRRGITVQGTSLP